MKWARVRDNTPPPGIIYTFQGVSEDGWTAMVCLYGCGFGGDLMSEGGGHLS